MGEYAEHKGERVKIGTCEDMYYLRADQVDQVAPLSGNVNPVEDGHAGSIRFRFPFPDEDHIKPGYFETFNRSIPIHGVTVPEGVEHHSIQFSAQAGYLVSLPCPEDATEATHGLTIHRNGFAGRVHIVQQKWFEGRLITICKCGGCGALYRVETAEYAQPLLDAIQAEVEDANRRGNCNTHRAEWWQQVGIRVAQGYVGVKQVAA